MPQVECTAVVERLKDIQPPAQKEFPTRVRLDLAVVDGAGFVVGPVEVDAGSGCVVLNALKQVGLLFAAFFVLDGRWLSIGR